MVRRIRTAAATLLVLAAACGTDDTAGERAPRSPRSPATQVVAAGDVSPGAGHAAHAPAVPADSTTVTVWKSPTCGCCSSWVDHMREKGFEVVTIDTSDVHAVKRVHGVAADLGSCHTATVGGYVLEGHVPAEDVRRLLAERPAIVGVAVPGMPMGSPGMEGPFSQKYDVIAFDRSGRRSVFASH